MIPNSLHEIIYDHNSKAYFGNVRTVAENGDSLLTGSFWLVDMHVHYIDGRRNHIAYDWRAIHCIMDDFGELVCDEFDFIAREAADNLRAWEFAVVIDGNFNICVGDW